MNEGFATFMEHICLDHIEPSWKTKDLFVVNELHQVFALDALTTSHKISVEVSNPDQINEIFDSISYSKGASIIRSMENFLTEAVFRRGLSNYLNKFLYQSATQDDLWKAMTLEAQKSGIFDETMSVKEIMDGWTLQTGFPYITVNLSYETNEIFLEQRRFVLLEANVTDAAVSVEKDPLWWVPITYTTKRDANFSNTRPSHWMKAEKSITIIEDIDVNDWLMVNLQVTGYYRVNYDTANWKLIIKHFNDPRRYHEIAQSNRAQLIDDAMNLARADILDYTTALDVTKYLSHETDYVPWKTAISNLLYIDSMLIRSPDYDKMKVSRELLAIRDDALSVLSLSELFRWENSAHLRPIGIRRHWRRSHRAQPLRGAESCLSPRDQRLHQELDYHVPQVDQRSQPRRQQSVSASMKAFDNI